ncbi:glycerophosphodiester phosphodiesterase [Pseudoclavibacter sp. AY1F1]|uniref:glycerophosphodiester phosphodiesterase family protein n=1 Tax=Pseudoclavibacter sp. AY1F1 TaxID=2080583 RepID=UPI000CE7ECE1|nr:glycerophosphodiester phosphodiesterase family protein [Pseudoclavibacter sp. AY1F1]PPF47448.1 glycerophosphodiester phosphodiesterase [Pseudoclavibacter sp. AY1F1]
MQHPYLDGAPPRVLAHRGLALEATENTMEAFAAAIAVGATHIETDARASSDGRAVLWHDKTLEGFDGSARAVADSPMSVLAGLRSTGSTPGAELLPLDAALDAFPAARFNIDVKSGDSVVAVADAVRRAGAESRVLITSFSALRLRQTARLLPGAARGAAGPGIAAALLAMSVRSGRMLHRALQGTAAVQIPERAYGLELLSPERLRAFHRYTPEVHVWTINDPATMRDLLERGVDGLVTDRADLAVKVVRSHTNL